MLLRRLALILLPILASARLASAATAVTVPPIEGQPAGKLEARFVAYSGHTNGDITIEVSNRGQSAETFLAQGLFFIPEGDPNNAPQRVGAVGPFRTGKGPERKEHVEIAPGAKLQITLDVYCIDSHRHSPSPETRFHLAGQRMPRELVNGIARDANEAAKPHGGVSAPAAKGAVQSEVWKNRDKKWIPLEGEGKQESSKQR